MVWITLLTSVLQVLNTVFIGRPIAYHRDIFWEQIVWQWIGPSLVHVNWMHWLLNILNFYAIILLFHQIWSGWRFIRFFLLGSFFIMLMLHLFTTQNSYMGMSGVLYGAAIYGAVKTYHYQKFISLFILLYVILKLLVDTQVNHLMGVDILLDGVTIVVAVHWYGMIFTLLFLIIEKLILTESKGKG